MPWLAAGTAAAGIAGGLLGGSAKKKAARAQAAAIAAAMAQAQRIIDEVGLPPDQSAPVILEQLQLVGVLTPELEQQVLAAPTKFLEIQEDPGLRQRQLRALEDLSKIGRLGVTPEERAQFNIARQAVQRDLQAKQEQIVQDLAMRGQAGGGAEIAARLLSSQESADRASEEADRISAMAAQRALQAIQQEGTMAGGLRGQDFEIAAAKAKAQDEFERFNVQNQIAQQQRNIATKNIAQERNLGEQQRVSDVNIAQRNQERYSQLERERQFWQDKMDQAKARISPITGMLPQQTAAIGAQGQAQANIWSGLAGGVGAGLGALGQYYQGQNTAPTPTTTPTQSTVGSSFGLTAPSGGSSDYQSQFDRLRGFYR